MSVRGEYAQLLRLVDGLPAAGGIQLVVDIRSVPLDGVHGDYQLAGDLFVGQALLHELQDFLFPPGQERVRSSVELH